MASIKIDADNGIITVGEKSTTLGSFEDCMAIALKAIQWKQCDHIDIIKKGFVKTAIIKKLKMCLIRNISCTINGNEITDWEDLNPYTNEVNRVKENINRAECLTDLTYLVSKHAPELIPYIKAGTIEEYLDMYMDIYGHGYGVDRMCSPVTVDRLSHGRYYDGSETVEWSTTKDLTTSRYEETLQDKINMYISLHWYVENGIEPEKAPHGITFTVDPDWEAHHILATSIEEDFEKYKKEVLHEDTTTLFVTPISACSDTMQMKYYG